MKIIITNQMLSIVPYLSTHWSRVDSMHVRDEMLVITLSNNESISIPNLSSEVKEKIFNAHALYLEHKQESSSPNSKTASASNSPDVISMTHLNSWTELSQQFSHGLSGELWKSMNLLLQHNPEQAHAPNLPPEALNKMSMLAQMLDSQEIANLPAAEPHCNCYHCQMMRALQGNQTHPNIDPESAKLEEEVISDQDLVFSDWEIVQTGEKLFHVTNRLDPTENYNVFLGEPVGCTCGKRGCPHVLAVLKS